MLKCLVLFACTIVLAITRYKFYANNMHSNTSPTCFEGPRGRKIGFRDLGQENITVFLFIGMTDLFWGVFCENVFFPKGTPKNSPKWVCLAGKKS